MLVLARSANAQDSPEPSPESCNEHYSVFRPLPEACLSAIDTDRPHKTDTPHTVPPGHAQVELGVVEYEKANFRGPSNDAMVLMNDEYRLGLTPTIEAGALFATGSLAMRSKRMAFGKQLLLRTKIGLFGDDASAMMLSLVPTVAVPVQRAGTFEGGGSLFFGAELPLELDFELDVGALSESAPDTTRRHAVPVVTTAFTRHVGGPVSAFGELYNETTTDDLAKVSSTLDTGILLALGSDAQLDVGCYTGLWGSVPALTPFLGFSVRR
jgi:hypothetical protein